MPHDSAEVCVLGAGLTGATAALELAASGVDVMLLEQDERPINRASLRNEGKIHLGFVYAKDDTLVTPKLMLDGALSFRGILRRTIGDRADSLTVSSPFLYLVAKDSLVSPADLRDRYAAIEGLYAEMLRAHPEYDYLGRRPGTLVRPIGLGEVASRFSTDRLIGAFATEERAIDTAELAEAVRGAIAASPRIRFLPRHKVVSVERLAGRFRVAGTGPDGTWRIEAGQVVNASWEQRLQIDRTIGIEHAPGWVHRLKYRIVARVPERLRAAPSVTMVLGPYGDAVIWPNRTAVFSWYPRGLMGWTHALSPPDCWDGPCRGEIDPDSFASIAHDMLAAIDRWYPGAAESEPLVVDAGAIVAYGKSDVDDPKSGLHDRTRVGVKSFDGYHTVDPGKLTTAPLFGLAAAREVMRLEVAPG